MTCFIIKGDICYSKNKNQLICHKDGYLVCENGVSKGVFDTIDEKYSALPLYDYSGKLVIPGMVDLHTHAPQYAFMGLGMDMELLSWLNSHAFPQEARYSDTQYAKNAYGIFVDALKHSATTRACIFATVHSDSTKLLMDMLEHSGIKSFVGKVNMDRNAPNYLCESSAQQSIDDTIALLNDTKDKYKNTYPILTPRFVISCTEQLLKGLGDIAKEHDIPVQSHLSENLQEIKLVSTLCPESNSYADAYDKYNLFGTTKTVMAHCVHLSDDEIELTRKNGVFVAHCAASNTNLCSGAAPVKRYLDMGLKVGLGSDVAGGHSLSIFDAIIDSISVSKLRYRLFDDSIHPLTFTEAFYMATKGGGEFFGNAGSFEEGYEFDAVVLDDSTLPHPQELSIKERLERCIYQHADRNCIRAKFVKGKKII